MRLYLSNRQIFKLQGDDIIDFLQGLTTSDMKKLNTQKSIYTAILNSSGKFLFDLFIAKIDEKAYFIDIADVFAENFASFIKKYKLRRNISLEKCDDYSILITENPEENSFFSFKDTRNEALGFRNIVKKNESGISSDNEYNSILIQNKIVDGRFLQTEKSIILEYGFEEINGVDFNKGCYIGQELITRAKRVGQVRKYIELIEVSGSSDQEFITQDEQFGLVLRRKNEEELG